MPPVQKNPVLGIPDGLAAMSIPQQVDVGKALDLLTMFKEAGKTLKDLSWFLDGATVAEVR